MSDGEHEPSQQALIVLSYLSRSRMTVSDLAEHAGIPRTSLSKFLNGRWKSMRAEALASIAKVLGIPFDLLADSMGGGISAKAGLPTYLSAPYHVLQPSPEGPRLAADDSRQIVACPPEALGMSAVESYARLAALRVTGDSMAPTVRTGDTLILDVTPGRLASIADGGIYLFRYHRMAHLRRLSISVREEVSVLGDGLSAPAEVFTRKDMDRNGFALLGRALGILRRV